MAISTQNVDEAARFYIDVFGLMEVGRVDSPGACGYYLSDGNINLRFSSSRATTSQEWSAARSGPAFTTLAFRSTAWRTSPTSSTRPDPGPATTSIVLGVGQGRRHGGNVEVKYSGPDGIMVDVSETGWVGTS